MQSMTTGNLNNTRLTSIEKRLLRKKDLKLNQPITSKTASQSITPKTDADGIETGNKQYDDKDYRSHKRLFLRQTE